jgi:excisionase family DNA binding protein
MSTMELAGAPCPDTLWTVAEVAAFLKVSRSWVYHRLESGLLPHIRVGGLVRFDPSAIRAHVSAGCSSPTARAASATIRSVR